VDVTTQELAPERVLGDVRGDLGEETPGVVSLRRRIVRKRDRGWLIRRMLLLADLAALSLAFILATTLHHANDANVVREALLLLTTLPAWVVAAKIYGLYDRDEERADHTGADDLAGVFNLVTVGCWFLLVLGEASALDAPDLASMVVFWILAIVLIVTGRSLARSLCRRSALYQQNTLIIGAGDVGQLIGRKLLSHPEYGINLVGFVDALPKKRRKELEHVPLYDTPEKLPELIEKLEVERVVIAYSSGSDEQKIRLARSLYDFDVQIDVVPRLFDIVGPNVGVHTVEGLPLLGMPPARMSPSSWLIKRSMDVVGASLLLLVTAPLFAIFAVWIKLDSAGPVFFRQQRLGRDMEVFTALKFRTMRVDADDAPHREYIQQTMSAAAEMGDNGLYKLDRDDAVTGAGRWLRKTSLDELPQLVNVLRGDMSLVGPRPCLAYETEHFAPHHFDRFLVPAGLTGLWQVRARGRSTFGEALDMDVIYAHSWSLGLDVKLLCLTPVQLLRRHATA
jgi:exopolysaccharide biosynthesis polyprenyl glycosylphosphotransferase